MTEIYKDQTPAIAFDIPNATAIDATFSKGGTVISTVTTDPAPVPYSIVRFDGEFTVDWRYTVGIDTTTVYTRTEKYDVVTPLFTQAELLAAEPTMATLTDAQIIRLERLVRKTIENATGQSFGFYTGAVLVYGTGATMLRLPRRAIRITNITSSLGTPTADSLPYWITEMDGFYVRMSQPMYTADSIKVPAYEEVVATGPLSTPFSGKGMYLFRQGVPYAVYGDFGWVTTPDDIKEAGLILAKAYSCNDATWRDKYIKTIRSSDWTFTYDGRAFQSTGSALVDTLLEPYVAPTMSVI
jgi:hypothetical protein